MFIHKDVDLPSLSRKSIDGVRYYTVNNKPMVSITSVTSHFNKEIFVGWRKKVGNDEANRITKRATTRGTAVHELIESHLLNKDVEYDKPGPKMLFQQSKPKLRKINNIYALEKSLYSNELGVAGTVDCIAEYDGELSIIDFKTAAKPKPREWIENYFVQAVAYACMFYELTNIPVKKLVIFMTCENGEVEIYEEYDKMKYMKLLVKYIEKFVEDKINAR
ncbi:MAG: exonuclease [Alphaproteobacteria bacterium TMED62]|mgnify:FL=1|nr:MAG: exonuclease [Alphaproteobacteria bacterium TMED62]|tara:strand:- start:31043 stop:31702 length:660 start_codon:yes stop_codon:yes gene_type:complete